MKFSIVLLSIVLIIGGVGFWFWQSNSLSKDLLRVELIGPDEVVMGDEVTYTVQYKNSGSARLEQAQLIFEYPGGTVPTEGTETRVTRELEDIFPGQERTIEFKGRLFGKERELKEARVLLSYVPKNLSATYQSDTTKTTKITTVPLNFELDLPGRIESFQEFEFALNYFSNSEYPLSDLRIKMVYPEGFTFTSASPSPIGQEEWKVGVVNRAEGGRITISGELEGGLKEIKIFKAQIGSWKDGEFTLFTEVTKGLEITEPNLVISQKVNGERSLVAHPGDRLHYEVSFKNASDRNLENLFLMVNLEGRPFDLDSVTQTNGTFNKNDKSLLWEAADTTRLRFLGRGEEGKVEFWINVKEEWEVFSPQDKNFVLENRVVLSDAKAEFDVKVNSALSIDQRGYFNDSTFTSQGSVPPTVGAQTAYTIVWEVKNLHNDVNNVKVRATLPSGVELSGSISPEDALLTFDSQSREVFWNVGDLVSGTGSFYDAVKVSFQVILTPQSSHTGRSVPLVESVQVTGEDVFTELFLSDSDSVLDTTLPDDGGVTGNAGKVQ